MYEWSVNQFSSLSDKTSLKMRRTIEMGQGLVKRTKQDDNRSSAATKRNTVNKAESIDLIMSQKAESEASSQGWAPGYNSIITSHFQQSRLGHQCVSWANRPRTSSQRQRICFWWEYILHEVWDLFRFRHGMFLFASKCHSAMRQESETDDLRSRKWNHWRSNWSSAVH